MRVCLVEDLAVSGLQPKSISFGFVSDGVDLSTQVSPFHAELLKVSLSIIADS